MKILYNLTTGGGQQATCRIALLDPNNGAMYWDGTGFSSSELVTLNMVQGSDANHWQYDCPGIADGVYSIYCTAVGGVEELKLFGTLAQLQAIMVDQSQAAPSGYASLADLAAFVSVDVSTLTNDNARMLQRASELVEFVCKRQIDFANQTHVDAARNATCAQVEFWMETGEDNDISGPAQYRQIGSTQINHGVGGDRVSPTYLAPRAERFLRRAGLLYRGASAK